VCDPHRSKNDIRGIKDGKPNEKSFLLPSNPEENKEMVERLNIPLPT
jgi:hypothetical protein